MTVYRIQATCLTSHKKFVLPVDYTLLTDTEDLASTLSDFFDGTIVFQAYKVGVLDYPEPGGNGRGGGQRAPLDPNAVLAAYQEIGSAAGAAETLGISVGVVRGIVNRHAMTRPQRPIGREA